MLILVFNQMVFASLLASDFPSENPRSQSRTFHMQSRCQPFEKHHV